MLNDILLRDSKSGETFVYNSKMNIVQPGELIYHNFEYITPMEYQFKTRQLQTLDDIYSRIIIDDYTKASYCWHNEKNTLRYKMGNKYLYILRRYSSSKNFKYNSPGYKVENLSFKHFSVLKNLFYLQEKYIDELENRDSYDNAW